MKSNSDANLKQFTHRKKARGKRLLVECGARPKGALREREPYQTLWGSPLVYARPPGVCEF